ncbi:MAG: TerD domain-containing protein [Clostridia bacterium]|nr:TerD domain-containing protein [Clostridia bacterium]
MSTLLIKGQKADLTKSNPGLEKITIGLGWLLTDTSQNLEVDASVFLLDSSGKCQDDSDIVFYGNPQGCDGAVLISNTSDPADKQQIQFDFNKIPAAIERAAIALTIYEADVRKQNFSLVQNMYIRILNQANDQELIQYKIIERFTEETAIVLAEIYRYKGDWKLSAVGSGYNGGLAALCHSVGIEVAEKPETPESSPETNPGIVDTPNTNTFSNESSQNNDRYPFDSISMEDPMSPAVLPTAAVEQNVESALSLDGPVYSTDTADESISAENTPTESNVEEIAVHNETQENGQSATVNSFQEPTADTSDTIPQTVQNTMEESNFTRSETIETAPFDNTTEPAPHWAHSDMPDGSFDILPLPVESTTDESTSTIVPQSSQFHSVESAAEAGPAWAHSGILDDSFDIVPESIENSAEESISTAVPHFSQAAPSESTSEEMPQAIGSTFQPGLEDSEGGIPKKAVPIDSSCMDSTVLEKTMAVTPVNIENTVPESPVEANKQHNQNFSYESAVPKELGTVEADTLEKTVSINPQPTQSAPLERTAALGSKPFQTAAPEAPAAAELPVQNLSPANTAPVEPRPVQNIPAPPGTLAGAQLNQTSPEVVNPGLIKPPSEAAEEELYSSKITITLSWSNAVDLDLHLFCFLKDGKQEHISHDHEGSFSDPPYIYLDKDCVGKPGAISKEKAYINSFECASQVFIAVNIYRVFGFLRPSESFSKYDGKVLIKLSKDDQMEIPLNSEEKGKWCIVGKIDNAGDSPSVTIINKVQNNDLTFSDLKKF